MEFGNGAPYYYDFKNAINSSISPSTVHTQNTMLTWFFRRHLLQRAISVFKWKLPETWNRDYFLYSLYSWGTICAVNTNVYGVICQAGTPNGQGLYYEATNYRISNPLLKGKDSILNPRIGTQCVLFKLTPDYGGIMDVVNYYAEMMALCSETGSFNVLNSKLSYVFTAKNKSGAESLKKMFDQINGGNPMVVQDKNLLNDDGSPAWQTFTQNLKQNYILSDILADLRKIEMMFDTAIGINNANTDKRERLISDEVNANNEEIKITCEMWLESLQKSCEDARAMFGIDISVDWRNKQKEGAENEQTGDVINTRDV